MLHIDARYPPSAGDVAVTRLLHEHPFALVISPGGEEPFLSHVPVVADTENGRVSGLRAHVARINPHAERLVEGAPVIVVFQGPNAYVSPTWYEHPTQRAPTWNYAVVHVVGRVRLVHDVDEIDRLFDDLAAIGEAVRQTAWQPRDYDVRRRNALRPLILTFEVAIERIDTKFKLNQHNSIVDREGAIRGLAAQPDDNSKAIAELMRETLGGHRRG